MSPVPQTMPHATRRFWRALLLIVLCGVALRVGYVLAVTQFDNGFYDAAFYETEARSIAAGRGFVYPLPSSEANRPAADHPPLTVLVLVPAAKLGGNNDLWMRFTMVLLGAAVIVVIGLLGRELAGDRAGLVAAGLGAVYANLWMNDGLLMSETLAALTTVGVVVLALRLMRRPTWQVALALGGACALATLSRAELLLLVPLLALPAAWRSHSETMKARLRCSAFVLCATAVVLAPWVVFNLVRFEKSTFLSTGDGIALLGANCATTYHGSLVGLWAVPCLPVTAPRGDESVVNSAERSRAIDYVKGHSGRVPIVVLARLGRLLGVYTPSQLARYNAGEGRPQWASYLGTASFLLLIPFAAAGGVGLRRRRVRLWPLLAPVWLVLGAAAAVYGTPRFRSPAEPIVVVLAAIGVTQLVERRWARRPRAMTTLDSAGRTVNPEPITAPSASAEPRLP